MTVVSDGLPRPMFCSLMQELARYGVTGPNAAAAADNLRSGHPFLLAVSGKQLSGKDTFAPHILQMLDIHDAVQHSFAAPLKNELDAILAHIRAFADEQDAFASLSQDVTREHLAASLARTFRMPSAQTFELFTADLVAEVVADRSLTSSSRTAQIRLALQHLGTDVRRAADPLYWVRPAVQEIVNQVAAGTPVFLTDARFPNEADAARDLGGLVVRLDVSRQVQLERLRLRDGLEADEAALTHASEVALDDYDHFDVRVANNGTIEQTLAALRAGLDVRAAA